MTPLVIPLTYKELDKDFLCMTLYVHTLGLMDMYMEKGAEEELMVEGIALSGCKESMGDMLPHLYPSDNVWN